MEGSGKGWYWPRVSEAEGHGGDGELVSRREGGRKRWWGKVRVVRWKVSEGEEDFCVR